MQRNVNIDVMKVVFAVIVVIHHMFSGTICGYLAVDFFFMISGFFLVRSYRKYDDGCRPGVWKFTLHKLMSFLPYLIVAEVFAAVIVFAVQMAKNGDIVKGLELAWNQLLNISCLSMLGLYKGDPTWYLSAMMISTPILYFLQLRMGVTFSKYIAPILGIIILLGIITITGRTNYVDERYFGFICKGLLLGISGMCLGMFAYECARMLRKNRELESTRMLATVVEVLMYLIILFCIFTIDPRGQSWRGVFEFFAIVLIFIAVTMTVSRVSYTSDLLSRSESLVRYGSYISIASLMLYLNHHAVIKFWNSLHSNLPLVIDVIAVIVITAALGIACYILGKRLDGYMRNAWDSYRSSRISS